MLIAFYVIFRIIAALFALAILILVGMVVLAAAALILICGLIVDVLHS